MKKYNFLDLIIEVLKESKFPLSANEIWKYALDKGFEKKLQTYKDGNLSKTPVASLAAKIYVNLNSKNSLFLVVSKRPTKFWLKERENELNLIEIKNISDKKIDEYSNLLNQKEIKFKERDLHPLAVKFLFESQDFNLYSKTILHEKSQKNKSGENEWIHPDIVGVHFPFKDYEDETFTFYKNLNQISYKLYSFELKIKLNFSNLRSSYFQAVSNSSWANEGYLIALEFDDEIIKELWRLNNAFGIGFIKLDVNNINDSKIIIKAKERPNLDLITLDLLIGKNKDFKDFIQNLNKDINISDIERIGLKFYDEIYNDEKMQKYLKDKKII